MNQRIILGGFLSLEKSKGFLDKYQCLVLYVAWSEVLIFEFVTGYLFYSKNLMKLYR